MSTSTAAFLTELPFPAALRPNTERVCNLLERYAAELELFNSAYDLVGANTREEILIRHIFDSLAAVPALALEVEQLKPFADGTPLSVADIGSGAGLPGIPLAIVFPNMQFTLVERMSKRCTFLENCVAVLGLQNVRVQEKSLENLPAHSFDIAVFRAFRPLEKKMAKKLLNLLRPEGFLAAYKARMKNIREEMDFISDIIPHWRVERLQSSFLETADGQEYERHLVLIPARQQD